jgi:hypothetical protein
MKGKLSGESAAVARVFLQKNGPASAVLFAINGLHPAQGVITAG